VTDEVISPQDAASELISRQDAEKSLVSFTRYTMAGYEPGRHHHLIAEALERVSSGECKRLIIQAPPRAGKSQLATIHFPAFYLGRHPQQQVITACHNTDLARFFGRQVRNLIHTDLYKNIFPGITLAADAKAANFWNTSKGGVYFSAGVGSGIAGRGGHLIVVDDPIRTRADADSKHVRDQLWDWYRSDLYSRRMPDAAIVIIATRWHDDDLTGRLLLEQESGTGDDWEVISLPAIAIDDDDQLGRKAGEALWPEWYPIEVLEQTKLVTMSSGGPREWSALYQQRPIAEESSYFKKEWVRYYNMPDLMSRMDPYGKRPYLHIYAASDYAVSGQGGDYTVHIVGGVDPNDDLYILDLWRYQAESDAWVDALIQLIAKWKPLLWAEESGQIEKSVGPFITKRMQEQKTYCRREGYSSAKDKPTRARSIQARMSMGKVFLPIKASWLDSFLYEVSRFPAGSHDDQVDAISLLGRILDQMTPGVSQAPPEAEEFPPTTYGDIFKAQVRTNRRHRRGFGSHTSIVVPYNRIEVPEDA
jgi:predicted phage terminase large subunit-like protein